MIKVNDLSGKTFGRLKVISYAEKKNNKHYWLCQCECGNSAIIRSDMFISGNTSSCGCFGKEQRSKATTKHGQSKKLRNGVRAKTPEYTAWCKMKDRCYKKTEKCYKNYGGRGIVVCERWRNSFEHFFLDMGTKPSPSHSLDRFPDNNGNYVPENCRWATKEQQCNNYRRNIFITYNNEIKTLMQWSIELGFNYNKVRLKIKNKIPFELALKMVA